MTRWLLLLALLGACVEPLSVPSDGDGQVLEPGDGRTVVLRSLRLDVTGFEEKVDLRRLQAMPEGVLDRIWLLDLDLTPLADNALGLLRDATERQARDLPPSARNMRRLLLTTADNVSLEGTSLEELVALAGAIGIPPARALAELLEVEPTEPILTPDVITKVVVQDVLATHPATLTRPGPIDAAHPDGVWPVTPNAIPITLGDVVSGFANLADRFGPATLPDGRTHPGFIDEADGVSVLEEAFALTVQVDANALPYRGLDLTDVSDASVNSTRSQIDTLFPVERDGWLTLTGLVEEPTISRLTMRVNESDVFHAASPTREPLPLGAGTAWDLDPWAFEHVVATAAYDVLGSVSEHCVEYQLGTGVDAFRGCIDATGWASFETFAGLGNPPEPLYLWDLMTEIAQVRLHDGGLAEGEADVTFSLQDVPLGISGTVLAEEVARNLAAAPEVLEDLAAILTENGQGAADLFYVRDAQTEVDALWFLVPDDIPIGDDGEPSRPYDYDRVGFFGDAELSNRISTRSPDGREVLVIEPGDEAWVQDDEGAVYHLRIDDKPSPSRVQVTVERVR